MSKKTGEPSDLKCLVVAILVVGMAVAVTWSLFSQFSENKRPVKAKQTQANPFDDIPGVHFLTDAEIAAQNNQPQTSASTSAVVYLQHPKSIKELREQAGNNLVTPEEYAQSWAAPIRPIAPVSTPVYYSPPIHHYADDYQLPVRVYGSSIQIGDTLFHDYRASDGLHVNGSSTIIGGSVYTTLYGN